jgi:hypothetical protein
MGFLLRKYNYPQLCWLPGTPYLLDSVGFSVQGWAVAVGQRGALAWPTHVDGFDLDIRWRSWEAGLLWAETDAIASLGLRLPCA